MPEEVENVEQVTQDDMTLLNDETVVEDKPVVEKEKIEGPEIEEVEEKVEDEEELKPEDMVVSRPTFKAIQGKYPNLFKDFPDLREMYFREQKYTEIYPTVEDAKEAQDKAENFDKLDALVSSGKPDDVKDFLEYIKENDVEIFKSFVDNFLPALSKSDSNKYYEITSPILANVLHSSWVEGTNSRNKDLLNSALHLSKFLFGNYDIATGSKILDKPTQKDDSLVKEKQEFFEQKFNDFSDGVINYLESKMDKEVRDAIDPKNELNNFMVETLSEKIVKAVDSALKNDTQHISKMNSLWKQANKGGFTKEWRDRIITAYLSRARVIMPAIRNKIRAQSVAQRAADSEKKREKSDLTTSRRNVSGSEGQRLKSNAPVDPKKVNYSKTSDMDLLNDNVTVR